MNRPVATSRISASSSQLSHSRRTHLDVVGGLVEQLGDQRRDAGSSRSSSADARERAAAEVRGLVGAAETWTRTPARPVLT